MSDTIISPEELQKEIDSYKKVIDTIQDTKCEVDIKSLQLASISKLIACIDAFHDTITNYTTLAESDIHNLELVKAAFLNLDKDMASKTLFDAVEDGISSLTK